MSILRRVEEGVDKPKPKVLFEPGEVVRVTDGPFNDFNGVVESVNYEKEPAAGGGADPGAIDARGIGFFAGRKGLS